MEKKGGEKRVRGSGRAMDLDDCTSISNPHILAM